MKNKNEIKYLPHRKSHNPKTVIKENKKQCALLLSSFIFIFISLILRKIKIFSFDEIKVISILVKTQFGNSQLFLAHSDILVIMLSFLHHEKFKKNLNWAFVKQQLILNDLITKLMFGSRSWQKALRVFSLGPNYSFLIQT